MLVFGQVSGSGDGKGYPPPERLEEEIQIYEELDRESPPPKGAIVVVGSSSIQNWRETIAEDFAPLTIIERGFGGSNMNDLLHFADRIVLPYKPRALIVYEGDNDIFGGIAPEKFRDAFLTFITKVHDNLPCCRIYFLSIKPSRERWKWWPMMKEANSLLEAECKKDKRLTFVDVASSMLDDKGLPRQEIFEEHDLHMSRAGYVVWRDALMSILLKEELPFESRNESVAHARE